jgi:2-polyprenyl-6-hydroxyphenyl methylase / 3-demethylubiquinone-9 3-methyltransferase
LFLHPTPPIVTAPAGTHDWHKFLQPQELARFGRTAGLRVRDVSGLVYNPLTGAWRLDREDTDVNFAMHLVKQ